MIPRWIAALFESRPIVINGDGLTSRDFCFIENVVQANILAAVAPAGNAAGDVFNVAVGEQTSLNELYSALAAGVQRRRPALPTPTKTHAPFRNGDVRHSLADIGKANVQLHYAPTHGIAQGLELTLDWFAARAD